MQLSLQHPQKGAMRMSSTTTLNKNLLGLVHVLTLNQTLAKLAILDDI